MTDPAACIFAPEHHLMESCGACDYRAPSAPTTDRDDPSRPPATDDERTIIVAEEFADEMDIDQQLRYQTEQNWHFRQQSRIWGPVVAVCVLGLFALIATIVYCVTTEHDHEHAHQVSVWCYADPNRNDATSELVGSPGDVIGKCPDSTVAGSALSGNP